MSENTKNPRKICVLGATHPYIHMLQAYNFAKFADLSRSSKIQHIRYSIYVTIFVLPLLIVIMFGIRHILMDNIGMSEFSTSFALLVIYIQMMFSYVVMVIKNRKISDGIDRIQEIIDTRE